MSVKVRIPASLQKFTSAKTEVESQGQDIQELLDNLEKSYPGIKDHLCDERGRVRRFINIYLNGEDIKFLKQDKTPLKDGDEIAFILAIAGG